MPKTDQKRFNGRKYNGTFTIWISEEDWPKWTAIPRKHRSEWVHDKLNEEPNVYDQKNWFVIPLELFDYKHVTAGPLPNYAAVSLTELDVDDYVVQVARRIKLELDEARNRLKHAQNAKTEVR